jgi:hypothetical protein
VNWKRIKKSPSIMFYFTIQETETQRNRLGFLDFFVGTERQCDLHGDNGVKLCPYPLLIFSI